MVLPFVLPSNLAFAVGSKCAHSPDPAACFHPLSCISRCKQPPGCSTAPRRLPRGRPSPAWRRAWCPAASTCATATATSSMGTGAQLPGDRWRAGFSSREPGWGAMAWGATAPMPLAQAQLSSAAPCPTHLVRPSPFPNSLHTAPHHPHQQPRALFPTTGSACTTCLTAPGTARRRRGCRATCSWSCQSRSPSRQRSRGPTGGGG